MVAAGPELAAAAAVAVPSSFVVEDTFVAVVVDTFVVVEALLAALLPEIDVLYRKERPSPSWREAGR